MADSDRNRNASAGIAAFLSSPRQVVLQGYVQPGKNHGGELLVDVLCLNERGAADHLETYLGGEADGQGGFAIGVEVKAHDADWCAIEAMASPIYVNAGDPSDTRRGFARVALYCPSGCETVEPERPGSQH